MSAYYNERDPFAAQWLRNLIVAGLIAPGHVDDRSIEEVRPDDLRGFTQCHFFAGIAGWGLALRLADVPDDRPLWTGSCPCQPFSAAGDAQGVCDERHLWPAFHRLIAECGPPIVFGEQVASKDGRLWLAGVRTDLENAGYAVGAADLCAASVSAPHIRQRLFWVALAAGEQVGNAGQPRVLPNESAGAGLANGNGYHEHWWSGPLQMGWNSLAGEVERSGRRYRAQWRIKPGLSIVAHGVPGRVGKLCGAGNAIVPQVAAEFIKAAIS